MVHPKIRQFAYPLGAPTQLHQMPECNGTTPPRVASLKDHQLTPARCVEPGDMVAFIPTTKIPFWIHTYESSRIAQVHRWWWPSQSPFLQPHRRWLQTSFQCHTNRIGPSTALQPSRHPDPLGRRDILPFMMSRIME